MIFKLPYPISNNRYYRTFRNRTVLSAAGRDYKTNVAALYKGVDALLPGEVALDITICPKQAKTGLKYKRGLDIDNYLKAILDSLEGVIYHDDKQVRSLKVIISDKPVIGGVAIVSASCWEKGTVRGGRTAGASELPLSPSHL